MTSVEEVVRRHIAGLKGVNGVVFCAEELGSGARLGTSAAAVDRFVVAANYAGRRLRWHVLYDPHDPTQPPDVILADNDDSFVDISRIPALSAATWNSSDVSALHRVCAELLSLLRSRHRDAALAQFPATHAAAKHDFEQIFIANDAAEVFFDATTARIHLVMPVLFDPHQPPATLQLSFGFGAAAPAPETRVVLPATTAKEFAARPPTIASFRVDGLLSEYCAKVAEAIRAPAASVGIRRHCFAALRKTLGHPIEFDAPAFTSIWWTFEDDKGLPVLLHLTFGEAFPTEQPMLVLQSGVYNLDGKPLQVKHKDFPYSPRWAHEELASRIGTFVREQLHAFTEACTNTPGMSTC